MEKSFPKHSETFRQHLTIKQEHAIVLTLQGQTIRDIAKTLNVSERTVYGWMQNEKFQKQLKEERNKIRDEALDKFKQFATRAVERLRDLLESPSDTIALRASTTILDFTLKARELEELEERLTALEKKIGGGQ